jgi:hypothetical protein
MPHYENKQLLAAIAAACGASAATSDSAGDAATIAACLLHRLRLRLPRHHRHPWEQKSFATQANTFGTMLQSSVIVISFRDIFLFAHATCAKSLTTG